MVLEEPAQNAATQTEDNPNENVFIVINFS